MQLRRIAVLWVVLGAIVCPLADAQTMGSGAQRQITDLLNEKASRTPAQRKMDSHLLRQAQTRGIVEVDIRAEVTPVLLAFIRRAGGSIVNSFVEYHAIRARIPAGVTFGHNAAAGAFTMAAVDVETANGGAFMGGASNPVYFYSSDGPRRMFYRSDGTAVTPGNLLFGTNGGMVLNKPDFTAADLPGETDPLITGNPASPQ